MEADDVLADHVEVGRPVLPEWIGLVWVAALGDVVGERVQPDVHDVLGIARHRHAPFALSLLGIAPPVVKQAVALLEDGAYVARLCWCCGTASQQGSENKEDKFSHKETIE